MSQRPNFSGNIQDELQKKVGDIAIWFNAFQSSGSSPVLTGVISVDGKNYRVALWVSKYGGDNAP
jgi:hypothetical protein